jgi:hypothetical protein
MEQISTCLQEKVGCYFCSFRQDLIVYLSVRNQSKLQLDLFSPDLAGNFVMFLFIVAVLRFS